MSRLDIALGSLTRNGLSALVVIHPGSVVCVDLLNKPPTLEQLQKAVEGYIEAVPNDKGLEAFCNEDGKIKGLAPNLLATEYLGLRGDVLVGQVVILTGVELDENGDYRLIDGGKA